MSSDGKAALLEFIPVEHRVGPAQPIDPATEGLGIGLAQAFNGTFLKVKHTL